jgi:hypothetical protein
VLLINDVIIAAGTDLPSDEIGMTGLELPRIAGITISIGEPIPIDQLRGQPTATTTTTTTNPNVFKPVPVVPEECT